MEVRHRAAVVGEHAHPLADAQLARFTALSDESMRVFAELPQASFDRFLALTEDPDLVGLLTDGDPLGARITVRSTEKDNRAVLA